MTIGGPDTERRLLPRWRSSQEAVNAHELRSTQPKKNLPFLIPKVPQFEEIRSDWQRNHTVEIAADLVTCAVSLGQTEHEDIQQAALLIMQYEVTTSLRSIASRVLNNTIGSIESAKLNSFDHDLARAEFYSQIASLKRRIRLYPKNALAWTDLARLYTSIGQQGKAREAIHAAITLAPDNRFVLRSAARFFVHSDNKRMHKNDIAEGLYILRGSRLVRGDPWIMAAEISLSTIVKQPPKSIKWARNLSDSDSIEPWDSSELNGALATLALEQGGVGSPGKLFNKSLRIPTENALAQAQWASGKHGIIQISESIFEKMQAPAFEALALKHRAERKWAEVIADCRAWSRMEPTSTRPLILGTFVAEVALEDGEVALEFAERALILAPNEPWASNNLAVALAYLGRVDEADSRASKYPFAELPDLAKAVNLATRGLIAYRRGEREKGLSLYLEAAHMKVIKQDPGLRAVLIWHILREEARLKAPGTQELADLIWKYTAPVQMPELGAMRERILSPTPSVGERAAAIFKSVTEQRVSIPSLKSATLEDFKRLFESD